MTERDLLMVDGANEFAGIRDSPGFSAGGPASAASSSRSPRLRVAPRLVRLPDDDRSSSPGGSPRRPSTRSPARTRTRCGAGRSGRVDARRMARRLPDAARRTALGQRRRAASADVPRVRPSTEWCAAGSATAWLSAPRSPRPLCWAAAVMIGERQARRAIGTPAGALLAVYAALGIVAASRVTGRPATTTSTGTTGRSRSASGSRSVGISSGGGSSTTAPRTTVRAPRPRAGVPRGRGSARRGADLGRTRRSPPWASPPHRPPSRSSIRWSTVVGRRTLGLGLFWTGLGLLRRRARSAAAVAHVSANTGAVLLGHFTGRDRF